MLTTAEIRDWARERLRPVVTTYYADKAGTQPVKHTFSKRAGRAVRNAFEHMQWNDYGALTCVVYDAKRGRIVATINYSITRQEARVEFKAALSPEER